MKSAADMEYEYRHPHPLNIPEMLAGENWKTVVRNTDTEEKFEKLLLKLLDIYRPMHWFNILKMLQRDITQEHKDSSICQWVSECEKGFSGDEGVEYLKDYHHLTVLYIKRVLELDISYKQGVHLIDTSLNPRYSIY